MEIQTMRSPGKPFALISALIVSALMFALAVVPDIASGQDKSTRATPSAQPAAPSSEVALPPWVEKLKLSAQQQQQARTIVSDYDAKVAAVWQQFTECYQQT